MSYLHFFTGAYIPQLPLVSLSSIGPSTAPSGIPIHARFAQAQRGGGGGGVDPAAPPSPAIDLATDVGMDVETAALLREVVGRKAAAVAEENFELAKALKLAQDTIRSVGATLAVLVADKNRAVQVCACVREIAFMHHVLFFLFGGGQEQGRAVESVYFLNLMGFTRRVD